MKGLKGSKTEKNLLKSFAGESQARNRYTYYASAAVKEGYVQIAAIFEETANQEKEHAKRFYSYLRNSEDLEITASYPAAGVSSTLENLIHAANGENMEHSVLYPEFARIAREEGFNEIAELWEYVSVAEKHHEERYRKLAQNMEKGRVFKREKKTRWRCRNCGYFHEGEEAPETCPACHHPKAHFEAFHCENID